MKKLLVLMLAVFAILPLAMSQEESEESKDKSTRDQMADVFFLALTTSTYTDLIISNLTYNTIATGNTDINGNPTFASIPFQSVQYNIVSFGIEPRFNLKEFDENASLSVSTPISLGIGSTYAVDDQVVRGAEGFGSIQVPLLLKINLGNGSTYKTQKDFGFNIGAGLEFNKIGIINANGPNPYNKAFVLPCFTSGVVFMRGSSPMEVNFKYGMGKLRTQDIDFQGEPLVDNVGIPYKRTTRGQSIKLSFIYLLNY